MALHTSRGHHSHGFLSWVSGYVIGNTVISSRSLSRMSVLVLNLLLILVDDRHAGSWQETEQTPTGHSTGGWVRGSGVGGGAGGVGI